MAIGEYCTRELQTTKIQVPICMHGVLCVNHANVHGAMMLFDHFIGSSLNGVLEQSNLIAYSSEQGNLIA